MAADIWCVLEAYIDLSNSRFLRAAIFVYWAVDGVLSVRTSSLRRNMTRRARVHSQRLSNFRLGDKR